MRALILSLFLLFSPISAAQTTVEPNVAAEVPTTSIPAATVAVTPGGEAAITVTAPVVVEATPATTEAVEEAAWWSGLADQALTALSTVLVAAIGYGVILLRTWINSKSKLAGIAFDQIAGDRLNEAAINIIRGEIEKLRKEIPGMMKTPEVPVKVREEAVDRAQPKFEKAFKETLEHFGKSGENITDYLRARVERAAAPVPVEPVVPYPQSRG